MQKTIWCVVQVLRYAWLQRLSAARYLLVSVVFMVNVKQTREILADLQHDLVLVAVLAA